MNIEIFFLTFYNFDRINRFKVNNNNNNNRLLNSETIIKHFLIILSTLRMFIQTYNKYTINQINRIFKEIFKVNLGLLNSFRFDNHCNLYRYQTRSLRRRQIAYNKQKLSKTNFKNFQKETIGILISIDNFNNNQVFNLDNLKRPLFIKFL